MELEIEEQMYFSNLPVVWKENKKGSKKMKEYNFGMGVSCEVWDTPTGREAKIINLNEGEE